MKLNVGCGINKLEGYVNIDVDPGVSPDLVHDFKKPLPYVPHSIDQIVMFHTIEHIQKRYHRGIILEFRRLLKPEGKLIISFPEFKRVVENWINNHHGQREFWEATIYGRQASVSDFHVCIMDSDEFCNLLITSGFAVDKVSPELSEPYNTVIKATPDLLLTYSDSVLETVWGSDDKIRACD